jgi:hypothetical protein
VDDSEVSDDELRACIRILRAIEADRGHLTRLTQEARREFLTLAGVVAKPDGHDLRRMTKAFRRAKRQAQQAHDKSVIEQAGLRIQRRSAVYAPLWLERPKPEAGPCSWRAPRVRPHNRSCAGRSIAPSMPTSKSPA